VHDGGAEDRAHHQRRAGIGVVVHGRRLLHDVHRARRRTVVLADNDRALLGSAAAAAAAASVGTLLRAVAADRSSQVHRGGPSIEDVVREEVRPLLKEWLDQHLPPLVERLVRAEIERVVGRGLS